MIIVVVGATATGKSDLAVQLAKKYNGEIISGDSIQVYKELNIGSAKITREEMQGIPHYFIDYCHYDEDYNVKVFQEVGRKYIEDILSRGKNVIICGGTGLYIKALLYDYVFHEEEIDENYRKLLSEKSTEQLYQMLCEIDFNATDTIHPNNRQRLIRALLMAHSGEKKSDRIAKQEHKMIYDAILIGLNAERSYLYNRINQRVDLMFDQGLVAEMQEIYKENVFQLQSMKAIGYKEFEPYYLGIQTIEEVKEHIKKNTRQLAKRQYTFFNNQFDIKYYSIQEDYRSQIEKDIEEKLHEQNK